ncbi:MAG TPA: DUF2336 domain-containing protein, partial [Caulobacteraceae bacterium]|nr:DUF2336 domain-containing protein [Caulobacteraceae bacterium]
TRRVPPLLDDILQRLVLDQPMEARARLATRLGGARWAPPALVLALAEDEVPVAQPVLLRSPHLADHHLLRLFAEGGIDHQSAIARRAGLSAPLVEAVLQTGCPMLMTALASNDTANLSPDAMRRLIEASRVHAALRTPLARHPRLTRDLALMLASWSSEALQRLLAAHFDLQPAAPARVESADQDERVVDKLEWAGELRLGSLLETLREGRLPLFVAALARLGGFTTEEVRAAIASERPELLALACASVGLDQSVFPTVLEGVRKLNGGRPGGGEEGLRRASGAFAPFDAKVAARAFRRSMSAV